MTTPTIASKAPRRTSPSERTRFLAEFDRSGLSAAAFAREDRLNYPTFCSWRQERAKAQGAPAFQEMDLPAVSVAPPIPQLVIELGSWARVRVGSEAQLGLAARLLQELNAL